MAGKKKGEAVEVVFCFDTTGSMTPALRAVRKNVEASLTRLFKEVPNLRIGLGANGDYCDKGSSYVTSWQDLTANLKALCDFARNVEPTGGGDLPECYELVLNEALKLDWSVNSRKVLVLIADDVPHTVNYPDNKQKLDWQKEAEALGKLGVTIHAVQCLGRGYATNFYKTISGMTGGVHLTLDQFSEITDLVMAICYQQGAAEQLPRFEAEIEEAGRMSRSLDANLARLSGRKVAEKFARVEPGLDAVPPGKFQIMDIPADASIREFVEDNDLIFGKGRGFYEFTKTEVIQEGKAVVLRRKDTGDMYTGDKAREMIGLPAGTRGKLKPAALAEYDVFVQSTSVNRRLIGGTKFLYEVSEDR